MDRVYHLRASSAKDTAEWITTLRLASRPVWAQDADECYLCSTAFSVFSGRHHCRACGQNVCGTCASTRRPLPHLVYNEPVRICVNCLQDGLANRVETKQTGDREHQGQMRRRSMVENREEERRVKEGQQRDRERQREQEQRRQQQSSAYDEVRKGNGVEVVCVVRGVLWCVCVCVCVCCM
jgi:hypothetical protein